ncbi:MAG: peptidylprolyl isomerase [Deltaproteobacteria bacterium]|nr:peptidylprolyl isomerase [Deltaproteobacteria bacterium]MBW2019600.1 peptidylprolyl isomerase [Deltaproteobacteria bacterium]MBW2074415.1 peptidylprolyl isomerase [Deltaproteobacteria bacterium]RLB82357.1 MAG: peptidylprolyl isomerase [Deltaproteobacteria bacterium]
MVQAKSGDMVRVHYTARVEDGTVFDSSRGGPPLEFIAGGSEVVMGFSKAVIGMAPGESKTVVVAPEDAFGQYRPGLQHRVPRNILPPNVEVGHQFKAGTGSQTFLVWVSELNEDFAILDANHPLAGRTVIYDLELVSLSSRDG